MEEIKSISDVPDSPDDPLHKIKKAIESDPHLRYDYAHELKESDSGRPCARVYRATISVMAIIPIEP